MKSKLGAAPVVWLVSMGMIAVITGSGLRETAKSGVLKKNGQKIWCKMQNKGESFCNSNY